MRSVSRFRGHRVVGSLSQWDKIVWTIVINQKVLVMDDQFIALFERRAWS